MSKYTSAIILRSEQVAVKRLLLLASNKTQSIRLILVVMVGPMAVSSEYCTGCSNAWLIRGRLRWRLPKGSLSDGLRSTSG